MEIYKFLIINFLFFSIIFISIGTLLFLRNRSPLSILVNYTTLLILYIPTFFSNNHLLSFQISSYMTILGLFIFPLTYTLMLLDRVILIKNKKFISAYFLICTGFLLYYSFLESKIISLFILHIANTILSIFIIIKNKPNYYQKILSVLLFLILVYISFSITTLDLVHLVISSGLISASTFLIILLDYTKKVSEVRKQFNKINELNRKLSHSVARMKVSNDQTRRIIIEKDLELFQMARHASLAEVTTGIAHELSQPLTGIKGIAQNMIDDINYEEFDNMLAVSELLKISSLVDKSSSIIDHIRNFSKKNVFSMQFIDLNSIILDAIDLINLQLKKFNIDLIFVLDDNIPNIYGDKISLEQLIVNIILNAKDAIIEKNFNSINEIGIIRITTAYKSNHITMLIEDNGIGIPDDIIQNIWSPFFTTKERSHGTGIGLSISNKIIKEHNATIDVNSSIKGTIFSINFPT